MRVFARLAILPLGLSFVLGACSDEEPSPVVDTRTAWQLCALNSSGGCASSEPAHRQEADEAGKVAVPFEVSCSESANIWNITITDPGDPNAATPRYRSVLQIKNANANTGSCAIEVREDNASGVTISYVGQCGDSGGCTINFQQGNGDWDVVASLACRDLGTGSGVGGTRFSLYTPPARDEEPVYIAVGNCN